MKKYLHFLALVFVVVAMLGACKKNDAIAEEDVEKGLCEPSNEKEIQIKDSVFYFTKLLSLWEEYLPPRNVNDIDDLEVIRRYSSAYCTGEEVLKFMMDLTPFWKGAPVDRFSFLDRLGEVSDEIQDAISTSHGMYVFYLQTVESGEDAYLQVRMVDKNSPAYHVGIRRGTRILSIDGNSNINWKAQQAENFHAVEKALSSKSIEIKFVNPDGHQYEKTLVSSLYNLNPILDVQVYNLDNKRIGYLALSSFVNIYNRGLPTTMLNNLNMVFSEFETKNINELIVDLRYNGGGAVATAEYLADRIVPSAGEGEPMYSYTINRHLNAWGWADEGDSFAPVKFNKQGDLNLANVYFLVTKSTASASELLINVLEPYMDVQLIGTFGSDENGNRIKENTYGKPVGFFGLPIVDDKTELYVTSFQMTNAAGESDYFDGISTDHNTYEDFFKDFGDPEEGMIADALYHIREGQYYNPNAARTAVASTNRLYKNQGFNVKTIEGKSRLNNLFKFSSDKIRMK